MKSLRVFVEFDRDYLRTEISNAHVRYWASRLTWNNSDPDSLGFELTEREDAKRGGGPTIHVIDSDRVRLGLMKMAANDGARFGRMLAAKGDGTDADALVQWIVLGELVYG